MKWRKKIETTARRLLRAKETEAEQKEPYTELHNNNSFQSRLNIYLSVFKVIRLNKNNL